MSLLSLKIAMSGKYILRQHFRKLYEELRFLNSSAQKKVRATKRKIIAPDPSPPGKPTKYQLFLSPRFDVKKTK
ncbi:MAG: hypothetical protein LBL39_06310, partial [Planctomycetaceae bacterium]|nr:hypothetical protein [Planctomycetaceae bacterium]